MPRILIVDDYMENRYLLETILQSRGHATVSAGDGAEALRLAGAQDFDLVLSDILMPVMDGFALCRAWKQDPRLARIPFVFYTATYTEPKDEQFALSLGADRFLIKPLPPEAILHAVQDLWPSQRVRVADRGLREGLLLSLMSAARPGRSRRRRGGRKGRVE